MDPKVMLAALGLPESATTEQLTEFAVSAKKLENDLKSTKDTNAKLLEAVGAKSTDEALGSIKGLREKAEKLDAIEVEREQEKAAALAAKKANLITAASQPAKSAKVDPANPHAGKLVPAQKGWAESCSIETLEGWLANAPVILIEANGTKPPDGSGHNGKTYDQMSNVERAECRANDPELFKQLRADAKQKGLL